MTAANLEPGQDIDTSLGGQDVRYLVAGSGS
jgi:hypothetical protein